MYSGNRQWHAVSIIADGKSCDCAQALQNLRYLSNDAPRLPMNDCSNPAACTCRYRHHGDRRAGPRRAVENFRPVRMFNGSEQRLSRGRRATD